MIKDKSLFPFLTLVAAAALIAAMSSQSDYSVSSTAQNLSIGGDNPKFELVR
ncbi:MAG: hypothetical protein AAF434_10260 [Pseudomonadota bacterium]